MFSPFPLVLVLCSLHPFLIRTHALLSFHWREIRLIGKEKKKRETFPAPSYSSPRAPPNRTSSTPHSSCIILTINDRVPGIIPQKTPVSIIETWQHSEALQKTETLYFIYIYIYVFIWTRVSGRRKVLLFMYEHIWNALPWDFDVNMYI